MADRSLLDAITFQSEQKRFHSSCWCMASKTELTERNQRKRYLHLARELFPRHRTKSVKPIVNGTISVGLFALSCWFIDQKYFTHFDMLKLPKSGWFLLAYLMGIFLIRVKETNTTSICYELSWGCNLALSISGIGCIMGRPLLIGMSIGLVGLDQMIWYMDIISFLLRRKYLLGAAGYLSHPEQTYIRSVTSLHHLWFLPFSMYTLFLGKAHLNKYAFPLAMFMGALSMIYARLFTPKFIWIPLTKAVRERVKRMKEKKKTHHSAFHCLVDPDRDFYLEYMNINCSHEFYPTVPIPFMHYCNASPAYIYLPITCTLLTFASYIPFFLMTKVSQKYLFDTTSFQL